MHRSDSTPRAARIPVPPAIQCRGSRSIGVRTVLVALMMGGIGWTAWHGTETARITSAAATSSWRHVGSVPLPPPSMAPLDLAATGDGHLLVADGAARVVRVLDEGGTEVMRWSVPTDIAHMGPEPRPDAPVVPFAVAAGGIRQARYVVWAQLPPAGPLPGEQTELFVERRSAGGVRERLVRWQPVRRVDGWRGVNVSIATAPDSDQLLLAIAGEAEWFDIVTGVSRPVAPVGPSGTLARIAVLPQSQGGGFLSAAIGRAGLRRYGPDGRWLGSYSLPEGSRALDIDVGPDGVPVALLGTDSTRDPAGPDAPVVVAFDPDGRLDATWTAGQLDLLRAPADGDWPWAIASAGRSSSGRLSLTGLRGGRVSLVQLDTGLAPAPAVRWRLPGEPASPRWRPDRPGGLGSGLPLAVAAPPPGHGPADGSELVVLDRPSARLLRRSDGEGDGLGAWVVAATVPTDTVDVAVDGRGGTFLATARVRARIDGDRTVWDIAAAERLSGPVSAGRWMLDADPGQRRILVRSPDDGTIQGILEPEGAISSLWPGDLAVTGDGRIVVADGVRRQLQLFDETTLQGPRTTVGAGVLAGPRRIAAGRLEDGSEIVAALQSDGTVDVHRLPVPTVGDPGPSDGSTPPPGRIAHFEPVLADGAPLRADDLAVVGPGELWLADGRRRALHVFRTEGTPMAPTPTATADLGPPDGACDVRASASARTAESVAGQPASLAIRIAARCPVRSRVDGADIVLVMDRSGSMAGPKLRAAREAARSFVTLLDTQHHRVALVQVGFAAELTTELSHDARSTVAAIEGLRARGGTDLAGGLQHAVDHLRVAGRDAALPVVVLLTDGRHNLDGDPVEIAALARTTGIQLYGIGLGDDADVAGITRIVGTAERTFIAPEPADLFPAYDEIHRTVITSLAGNLVVAASPADAVPFVPGSSRPPAVPVGDGLEWGQSVLPTTGITLSWQVRPQQPGRQPAARSLHARFVDADGVERMITVEPPLLDVVAPTATPTPPPPPPIVLPVVVAAACPGAHQPMDVVLLIDTSNSMRGPRLGLARALARAFVDRMASGDRIAVIGFDTTPRIAAPLTEDPSVIHAGIDDLSVGRGTRMDRALRAASGLLKAERAVQRTAGVLLISDGGHEGDVQRLAILADALREDGFALHAIGLETTAGASWLTDMVGPSAWWPTDTTRPIGSLVDRIARAMPCR